MLKILFNHTTNAGVIFYRMINPAKYMRRVKGVEVAYSKFYQDQNETTAWEQKFAHPVSREAEDLIIKQWDDLMGQCDVAVWQMLHEKKSLALFLAYRDKFKNKKILMEVDDYLYGVNPESMASHSYYPNSELEYLAEIQMRSASGLIVSTEYLKQEYSVYNPYIEVVPNAIDFEVWDNLKNKNNTNKIRIGWSGGQAHYLDLEIINKIMPAVLDKYKNVEFVIFGGMPEYMKTSDRVKHISKWVGIEDYPGELANAGFDIGLAPLRDNKFNRCKSNLRWLEYSALKVPTIASPVTPFLGLDNIEYALEAEDWINKISELVESKQKRKNLGLCAYAEVKKKFNAEVIGRRYARILRDFKDSKIEVNQNIYLENMISKLF